MIAHCSASRYMSISFYIHIGKSDALIAQGARHSHCGVCSRGIGGVLGTKPGLVPTEQLDAAEDPELQR